MLQTDIGAYLEPAFTVAPVLQAAATVSGTGVDRLNTPTGLPYQYHSAMLVVMTGATVGTPTSFTVDARFQDSADNTTFADFNPGSAAGSEPALGWVSIPTITAINTIARVNVNLTAARRYLRPQIIVAFVGGTTPTIGLAATIILGGADRVATA